jgi:large subunit ribosomal protein L17
MRHHNHNRKFNRKSNVRLAFMRSLARALVMEGRIMTTEPRAKELRPYIEKMITRAKAGNMVTDIRILASDMGGQLDVAQKLIKDIAPKYTTRNGGYTRILKTPARLSDGAPMALIEFV